LLGKSRLTQRRNNLTPKRKDREVHVCDVEEKPSLAALTLNGAAFVFFVVEDFF
jgi:hypothetical protein